MSGVTHTYQKSMPGLEYKSPTCLLARSGRKYKPSAQEVEIKMYYLTRSDLIKQKKNYYIKQVFCNHAIICTCLGDFHSDLQHVLLNTALVLQLHIENNLYPRKP